MSFNQWRVVVFTLAVNLLGMAPFGYHCMILNLPQADMLSFLNRSYSDQFPPENQKLDPYKLSSLWSFTVCILQIGVMLGSLSVAYFAQKLGRRVTFFFISGTFVLCGSVLQAVAFPADVFELIIIGRFVTGYGLGLATVLVIYVSECSPDKLKGQLGAIQGVMGGFGALVGNILSLPSLLGQPKLFPYMLGISVITGLFQLGLYPFFPESPKFLYLQKHDVIAAEKSIRFYHGADCSVEATLEEYEREKMLTKKKLSIWEILGNSNLRRCILTGCLINFAAMDTGLLALMNYSAKIFRETGASKNLVNYGSVVISVCSLIAALVGISLAKKFRRRPLLLGGLLLVAVLNSIFPIVREVNVHVLKDNWLSYVGIGIILLQLSGYMAFISPVYWYMTAEFTPQVARSLASAVSLATASCTSVVLLQLFLVLDKAIGSISFFVLFVAPSIVALGLLWRLLPETKDRSIGQITNDWWIPNEKDGIDQNGLDDEEDDDVWKS